MAVVFLLSFDVVSMNHHVMVRVVFAVLAKIYQSFMYLVLRKFAHTLIHGCCNNSLALIRFVGSRSSIDVRASRHSMEIFGKRLKSIVRLITLYIISSSLSLEMFLFLFQENWFPMVSFSYPSYGAKPLRRVNVIIPRDHMSFSIR